MEIFNCGAHLSILKNPSEDIQTDLLMIAQQALENISSIQVVESYVSQILAVLHQAYDYDPKRFITEILYGHTLTIRPLQLTQDYIFDEFATLRNGPWDQRSQIRLTNIYLQIVSNLFEPYLSILVASFQLVDNKFNKFVTANLHAAERNKWEFLTSRLSSTNLFMGYNPLIRNAIAHAGSHSVVCKGDKILFRNIDRTLNPAVKDHIELATAELVSKIVSIIDFTQSVDVAVNIFGLDVSEVIGDNDELKQIFHDRVMRPEQRNRLRDKAQMEYLSIWNNDRFSDIEKLEYFAKLFTERCEYLDLKASALIVHKKTPDILIIKVIHKPIDLTDKEQLVSRAIELIRFAIVCEPYFRAKHNSFLVEEEVDEKQIGMQAYLLGEELKAYHLEEIGMYDLLHDGSIYRNKIKVPMIVNFDEVERLEALNLENSTTRKNR